MENNEQIFIRSFINDIGRDYSEYLYEKVLLFCESPEIEKLKGSDIRKVIKEFSPEKIKFNYKDTVKENLKNKKSKNILKHAVYVQKLNNEIHYVPTGNKVISLVRHIRNAFAHNLFVIENDCVVMGDFLLKEHKPNFNNPTMLGRVSKDNFELLISTIESMKK